MHVLLKPHTAPSLCRLEAGMTTDVIPMAPGGGEEHRKHLRRCWAVTAVKQ